jgi:hypothetical protein
VLINTLQSSERQQRDSFFILYATANNSAREGQECTVVDRFKSPYVTAYISVPVVPFGCVSQQVTSSGQQIHVINLKQPRSESSQHHVRAVNLILRPVTNLGKYSDTWFVCQ